MALVQRKLQVKNTYDLIYAVKKGLKTEEPPLFELVLFDRGFYSLELLRTHMSSIINMANRKGVFVNFALAADSTRYINNSRLQAFVIFVSSFQQATDMIRTIKIEINIQ